MEWCGRTAAAGGSRGSGRPFGTGHVWWSAPALGAVYAEEPRVWDSWSENRRPFRGVTWGSTVGTVSESKGAVLGVM